VPAPAGAARAVWWALGGLLVLGMLVWGTFNVVSLIAHEEYTQQSTFPAADVQSLVIDTDSGSATVIAAPVDTIEVTADVSDGLQKTKIREEIVDGRLELEGSCPGLLNDQWCRASFTVRIPADRPVMVDADDGAVEVTGIDGVVNLENDNGRIEFSDIGGNITVSNDNGRIVGTALRSSVVSADNDNGRIELSFATSPTLVQAENDNGRIEVAVPDVEGETFRVQISNSNGSEEIGVRTDSSSERVIDLTNDDGSVTVRYAP
jgi:hypothetical protein